MSSRMLAALCAALVAALLSLGGASLVVAGQPAKGGGHDDASGNAKWQGNDQADQAPAPAAAPDASEHSKSQTNSRPNRSQKQQKQESAPKSAPKTYAPKTTAPKTGGGSQSTATSGPGNSSQGCDGSHNSDTGHGANHSGPYDNTCTGAPSGNGNGNGQATGKPCAGCVGNADDKNPKGQYPNGSDHNAGYECDRNHGIGRTNPAHTGCTSTETTTTPPAGKHEGDHKGADNEVDKSKDEGCPSSASLASALKHSAALALKAAALMHPGLKKLAKLADATTATGCTHSDNGNGHTPVTICHATGSATNPFVKITIDENGLHGHGKHADDIIPAPAEGCPAGSTTAAGPNGTEKPPTGPANTPVTPLTTVLGTTESGQPVTTPTPGEQIVLGVRRSGTSTPAGTTAPAGSTTAPASEVLGETAGGATPAAAVAPAAAQATQSAANSGGSLPFTGTDALLVLFLGCLVLLGGITMQRLTRRQTD